MPVKVKDDNRFLDIIKILEEVNRTEIQVGIFGGDDSFILMIANVHEYGCTIKPKRAKRLAIPLHPSARGKSPREFTDLYLITSKEGNLLLVRDKGTGDMEFMYWLATEVHIPERSFIRGGFDEGADRFAKKAASLFKKVIVGSMPVNDLFTLMGEYIVGELKKYMTNLKDPPKSGASITSSGKSNPLINTGRLRDAITYKVVKK